MRLGWMLMLGLPLVAQDEMALRRFFEGKKVRVKMDMPASHLGVDVFYKGEMPVNFREYGERTKKFGIALREGDAVMITTVKVKERIIEFQLGGGGYGTFGDDSGSVSYSSVSKSSREKDLEKELKNTTDSRRRDELRRELGRLESARRYEDSRRREDARRLETIKKAEIAEKRKDAGSRFNLRFPERYLQEAGPTPSLVMGMLEEYVDFGELRARAAGQ
ncbi:MAG: hypothetical protein JNK48_26135 [Bryobacterales bacterium]|nr:hypothetical protein [Bryobacterales bacterium]